MPLYECVYLARQELSSVQVEAISGSLSEILEPLEGKIVGSEYWGLRNLAYKIGKSRKAHYVMLNVDAPHTAIAEMERNMRLREDIMRFLTTRVDGFDDEPSVMMQSQAPRNSRHGSPQAKTGDSEVKDSASSKGEA